MRNYSKGDVVLVRYPFSDLSDFKVRPAKRGLFTTHQNLIIKTIGRISSQDSNELERSLRAWLGL